MDGTAEARMQALIAAAAQLRERAGAPRARDGSALPALILVTDAARHPDPLPAVGRLPQGSAVLLRDYEHPERAALAGALADACRLRGLALWVGADVELARSVNARALHLRERDLVAMRPARWHGVLTAAAHSAVALQRAHAIGADAAVLAPVFATASHPRSPSLGPAQVRALVRGAGLPVLALGGIDADNVARLLDCGVAGIAAVGAFIPRRGAGP